MTDFDIGLNPPSTGWAAPALAIVISTVMISRVVGDWRRGTRRPVLLGFALCLLVISILSFGSMFGTAASRTIPLGVIVIATVSLVVRGYAEAGNSASRTTRVGLAFLRLMTIFVVFLVFLRPVASWMDERRVRPTLMIVRDGSRSMTIADVPDSRGGFKSRGRAVRQSMQGLASKLSAVAENWDIVYARFSDTLAIAPPAATQPIDPPDDGPSTAIGGAIAACLTLPTDVEHPLGAVILISDGAENLEGDASSVSSAKGLAGAEVALYTVGVGSAAPMGDTRTIVGRALTAPDRASAGTKIPVSADFECLGFADEPVEVELLWEGEPVDKRTIVPKKIAETARVAFEIEARPAGFRAVEVRARPKGGATSANTASLSKFVQVIDDALQVLLVESRPRSESAFISRALAGEPRVRLTRMYLARPPEGDWSNPLPAVRESWREYQVVLFGEVTRSEATDRRLEALAEAVEKDGVGLGILGGLATPSARSLLTGPLADVIPMRRPDKGDKPGSGRIMPTVIGTAHPVCSVEGATGASWEKTAFVPTGATLGHAKPAAQVLLTDEDKRPVLVVQSAGQGRTAAMAIDATWRWAMQSDEGAELHRRFWRQLALWLAGKPIRVHVSSDRPRYDLAQVRTGGRGIRVDAHVFDGAASPTASTNTVSVVLVDPDGKETPVVMQPDEGRWVGRTFAGRAGSYTLQLKVVQAGKIVGEAESRFLVEDIDRELREPLANPEFLRSLAAETVSVGGRFVELGELSGVLDALSKDVTRQVRTHRRHFDLTIEHGPLCLTLVIALLTLEWVIRKRAGLV